jgi:hypothetical protein
MVASADNHVPTAVADLDFHQSGLPPSLGLIRGCTAGEAMRPCAWRGAVSRREIDRAATRASSGVMTATRTTALALIAQYGDDAETIAMLRAAKFAALGDLRDLADWDAIIADIRRLDREGPGGALN